MTDTVTINGMDTREIGVTCTSLPPIQIAQARVSKIPVPARSGYLHVEDDSFESQIKPCGFFYDGKDAASVAEFFRLSKTVIFSNEPDRIYTCEYSGQTDLENTIFDWHEFSIDFECNPEKREANPQEITAVSGMTITHPGNRKTRPTFEITGTGTVALLVGTQSVTITGIDGTTIIDGDLQACYTSLGAPRDSSMTGECPILLPGVATTVSWSGDATIVIKPNWRWV